LVVAATVGAERHFDFVGVSGADVRDALGVEGFAAFGRVAVVEDDAHARRASGARAQQR